MDNGLVPAKKAVMVLLLVSLNPYCSGQWSRTLICSVFLLLVVFVLILIVVEDGLVLQRVC